MAEAPLRQKRRPRWHEPASWLRRVEDATERLSACYGMWSGSYLRADLTAMRKVASALSDAPGLPGSAEAMITNTVVGITHWFEGDYVGAHPHLERAIAAYDHERDRHLASRFDSHPGITSMDFLARVLRPLWEVDKQLASLRKQWTLPSELVMLQVLHLRVQWPA